MLPSRRETRARQLQRPQGFEDTVSQRNDGNADRYPLLCRGYEKLLRRKTFRRYTDIVRRSSSLRRSFARKAVRILQGGGQSFQTLLRLRDDQQDTLDALRSPVRRMGDGGLPRRKTQTGRQKALADDNQSDEAGRTRKYQSMERTPGRSARPQCETQ